jgi:hypothetical protein
MCGCMETARGLVEVSSKEKRVSDAMGFDMPVDGGSALGGADRPH